MIAPTADEVLSCGLQSHPRLLLNESKIILLKDTAEQDETAQWMYQYLKAKADGYLDTPPAEYSLKETYRLSDETTDGIKSIPYLAFMYLMTENAVYAERAYEEMYAICRYSDWNEQHFLDTALILESMAIGYDWLSGYLDDTQKLQIRTAMINKGLSIAEKIYNKQITSPANTVFWLTSSNNWNSSCNEAIILAAIAIGEDYSQYHEIVSLGLDSLMLSLKEFEPDGGWVEGLSYWNTMMTDYSLLFAGMKSALNTEFGYSGLSCLKKSMRFGMDMTGNCGIFNFSDCDSASVISSPALFWFGAKYSAPLLCSYQKNALQSKQSCSIYDFIWYHNMDATELPVLDSYYRNIDTVSMRSGFDENDIFVGFHSGSNSASHTHLDTGSFVLDALGERWFGDFGRDRSSYTGADRATLYQLRAEGHNTLVMHNDVVDSDVDSYGLRCIVKDDFESKFLNYPSNTYGDATYSLLNDKGNQFVRLVCNETESRSKVFFQKEFKNYMDGALTGDTSISFDVRIQNAQSDIAPITVRDSQGTEVTSVFWLTQNKTIRVMNGKEKVDVGSYETGKWYTFTLKFDLESNTVDVYCGNNLIANDFALTKELCDIYFVRFPIFSKIVTMDIDNLKVYTDITEEQMVEAKYQAADQSEYSDCKITSFVSADGYAEAVTDMTDAYSEYADYVSRKVALYDDRTAVMIEDNMSLKQGTDVYWFAHTDALIHIDGTGKTAELSKNGKTIRLEILSDEGMFREMESASLFIDGQGVDGYTKLAVVMQDVTSVNLKIDIRPLS